MIEAMSYPASVFHHSRERTVIRDLASATDGDEAPMAIEGDPALDLYLGDELVHAVEGAHSRKFMSTSLSLLHILPSCVSAAHYPIGAQYCNNSVVWTDSDGLTSFLEVKQSIHCAQTGSSLL